MNPIEFGPVPETPKDADLEKLRPEAKLTPHGSEAPIVTPEDEKELSEIEQRLDGLRQEIQTLRDAIANNAEATREWKASFERPERKFLGIFPRKRPKLTGRLAVGELERLYSALETAEKQLGELLAERDALEERMLDVETLRGRRKTRISDEYLQVLQETGRAITSEEKHHLGLGREFLEHHIDQDMEYLKKKRSSN